MYFLRNQLLFYDTWYCIYASISSSHIILWRRGKSFELATPARDFMHLTVLLSAFSAAIFFVSMSDVRHVKHQTQTNKQ
jgi:tryptophan-rich sensory protein